MLTPDQLQAARTKLGIQPQADNSSAQRADELQAAWSAPKPKSGLQKAVDIGAEVVGAIANPSAAAVKLATKPVVEKVAQGTIDSVKRRNENVKDIKTKTEGGKQTKASGLYQAAGQVAGTIGDVGFETLKAVTPQPVKDVAKAGIEAVAETEQAKQLAKAWTDFKTAHPEAAANIEATGNIASIIPVGGALKAGAPVLKAGMEATEAVAKPVAKATTAAIEKIKPATQALYERASEIVKPSPSTAEAVGQVLQAKKPITARTIETFRNIDTEGVKTYAQLKSKIDNSIADLSENVDSYLAQDTTAIPLQDLVTKTTSGSGRVVERNFVQTALDNLKELYQKSADDVGLADVEDIIEKAKTGGLTKLEINQISRLYNSEFGSKAFSKVTGEPITSVNAQAYENIRKGLKDMARSGMGGSDAAAADKIISSLYETRDLVNKNVAAVQKLKQKISERGLFEKAGHALAKYGDVLTGGSIRGFIGGLLPRGAGYKVMNALDLEAKLSKNLQIIRKALDSGSDDEILKAIKQLEASASETVLEP